MKARNFLELRNEIEELIRVGNFAQASRELAAIPVSQIPREFVSSFAGFARRTGLFGLGLRMLRPVVHPEYPLTEPADSQEKAIYSALLIKIGAFDEASEILVEVDDAVSEKFLYQSFGQISQWNYLSAKKNLKKYLRSSSITDYQRAIGTINLAAAEVFLEEFDSAEKILDQLMDATKKNDWKLLYSGCLELKAQISIVRNDLAEAENLLRKAEAELQGSATTVLWFNKWKAIVSLKKEGFTPAVLKNINDVKAEALRVKEWETLRDLDYHMALTLKDEELFLRVYFGTPFSSYRRRMERHASMTAIPRSHVWSEQSDISYVIDLEQGTISNGAALPQAKALHRTLNALAADCYRPQPIGGLFSVLYPGEYFNPVSSQDRVTMLISRLRKWLVQQGVPLNVLAEQNSFSLGMKGPVGLKMLRDRKPVQREKLLLKKLRTQLPYKSFSSSIAGDFLNISTKSAQLLLKGGVRSGKLYQSGKGRATLYRFSK